MTGVTRVAAVIAVSAAAAALGCGRVRPETVDPRRPANVETQLDRLAERIARAPLTARPAGFAALSATDELLFIDGAGATTFRAPSAARDLRACGDAICELEAERVQLRAWPAGARRGALRRSGASRFVGGAVDGDGFAWVEAHGPREGHLGLASLERGALAVTHELPADGDLGAPLLRGGVALLPHDGHELLFVDSGSGRELARRRSPDDTIRWVRVDAEQVYYGGERAYALRAGNANQRRSDATLDPDLQLVPAPPFHPALNLPDRPDARGDQGPDDARVARAERQAPTLQAGAERAPPPRPAPVHWTRVPLEPSATLAADRAYVVSRGHVFAFDGAGVLLFVHALRAPPLATLATADGLLLLHVDGHLQGLHPDDGSLRFERALPPLRVARAVPAVGPQERSVPPRAAPSPSNALVEVLRSRDTRFVADQVYAAHLLTTAPESVAADLLGVYTNPRTEPPVQDAVAMTLRARSQDTDALVRALGDRYDFLATDGVRPAPPLAAIIRALARAERHDAYDALLAHLDEPATPLAALPLLVDQLVRWGGPDALPPLLAFVRRYRADSSFGPDPTALVHAALAIDALGGDDARRQLDAWFADPATQPAVIEAVAHARQTRRRAEVHPTTAPVVQPESVAALDPAGTRVASADSVEAHAAAHMEQLDPCLEAARAADPSLRGVRVRMVLERGGHVSLVSTLPGGELERCLADVLVTLRWPRIEALRQQVGFTLRFAAEPPPPPASAPAWWQRSATHAQSGVAVQPGLPWWESPSDAVTESAGDQGDTWWRPDDAPTSPDAIDRWWRPSAAAP